MLNLSLTYTNDFDSQATNITNEKITVFYSASSDNYFFFDNYLTDDTFIIPTQDMIPFLTVQDNLLLGIKRKNRADVLTFITSHLDKFKLSPDILSLCANEVSRNQQTALHIMRAIALKQPVLINQLTDSGISDKFLFNLLPVLSFFVKKKQATMIILTNSTKLLDSTYYDQCINLPSEKD